MSWINLGIPDDVFDQPAAMFEQQYKCEVHGRRYIIDECFMRIYASSCRDFPAQTEYKINQFKMAGLLCFWVRKLKPFWVDEPHEEANRYVNETMALYSALFLIFGYLRSIGKQPNFNFTPEQKDRFSSYLHDLIVSLRYNSFSPHSTAYLFESLFITI